MGKDSNDKFNDHIFSVSEDKFKKYFSQLTIRYEVISSNIRNKLILHMPDKVSYSAQKIEEFWHIPVIKNSNMTDSVQNKWICCK